MELNTSFSRDNVANSIDTMSRVEDNLFTSLNNKMQESAQLSEQLVSGINWGTANNASVLQKLEELKSSAEDNFLNKKTERTKLFQSSLKSLNERKDEEEEKLRGETKVLEEVTNQTEASVERRRQLKEEKRNIARKEKSIRDESTYQFYIKTLKLHFIDGSNEEEVKGIAKNQEIVPFAFSRTQLLPLDIADKLWDIVESL